MKSMAKKYLLLLLPVFVYSSCEMELEPLEIQKPFEYDEQYYSNLRAYKQSDHTVFFGWYAAYGGGSGYKDPASWGERILGLPDSVDIISFWSGVPGNDPNDPGSYKPIAYADWKFVREKKGTRFVATTITRIRGKSFTLKDGASYDIPQNITDAELTDEMIEAWSEYLIQQAETTGVDGIDLDYEPEGSEPLRGNRFLTMVKYIGKKFGPLSEHPERLFTINFYAQIPPAECGPYVNYYIRQAYTQGFTEHSATRLQSYYDAVSSAIPPEKFIVTEQMSVWYANGGSPFVEADGNRFTTDGSQMYSMEGMARWNPTQGKKGGFGGFYFDRDYYHAKGPYYNVRRAIQIANPAVR